MSTNLFRKLLDLLPDPALQVGQVVSISGGVATIQLPGGGTLKARGTAAVSDTVFVRGGVIEGAAPSLTVVAIDV